MATEIIMPKAGMDMEEGTVTQWLKNVGDTVEVGEPILEIQTDKVNMEVEAEVSGTLLNILAKEGDVFPIFTVIGYIGEPGEKIPTSEEKVDVQPTETSDRASIKSLEKNGVEIEILQNQEGEYRATPAARKFAKDRDVSIREILGSGPLGRVQLVDVEEFNNLKITPLAAKIAEVEHIDLSTVTGTGVGGKITKDDVIISTTIPTPVEKAVEGPRETKDDIIPMIGLRKIIAERMKESLNKSAPVTLNIEVDMTTASSLREKLKPIIQNEIKKKVTLTDLIIMATSKALMRYPMVNATLVDEGIRINDRVNMGIAIDFEKGLLVPVIAATNKMSLKEIVSNRTDMVEKTLTNKITPDDLSGSTFTISNLGMFDTISFTSIINQPNSAILSVGTTTKRMRVVDDQPQIRLVMTVSLTLDHRVIDGLYGAQFLQHLKDLLEDPTLLLL